MNMNITLRKAVPGEEYDITRVIIRTWKTAYRGIIDDSYLDSLNEIDTSKIDRLRNNIEKEGVLVAADAGCIIGVASFGEARDEKHIGSGELVALYVLSEYQGSGIGRMLITAVKTELLCRGHSTMIVDCLTENSACRFYEKEGGKLDGFMEYEIGGKSYGLSIFKFEIG